MGLNDTVSSERVHIGVFGMRNAGKSSLVNAITGQQLAVVSEVKGTTTDPVKKAMELLPLGPVVIIDTPGLDDEGELGTLRVQKAKQILDQTDIAVLVVDGTVGILSLDEELVKELTERKIPYIVVYNKADLFEENFMERNDRKGQQKEAVITQYMSNGKKKESHLITGDNVLYISTHTGKGIHELKEKLGKFGAKRKNSKVLIADLLDAGDFVVLVTPIDESAPKGRLILPQQLTIRDILDVHGIVVTCQDTELPKTLESLAKKPKMVITDSQAFARVSNDTPIDIPLTSFSILMARYKGDLKELVHGAAALSKLRNGDKVLISEGCTHHRQCNDIGTVKMPNWIQKFTGVQPEFTFSSGGEFPEDLSKYSVIVHCGGCTLDETEMQNRIRRAKEAGVPIVNYGIAIAQIHGILKRSVELFPDVASLLE